MIGEFSQLTTFLSLSTELIKSCCDDKNYPEGEMALRTVWGEFLVDADKRINEQDTHSKLSIFIKITQNNLVDFLDHLYTLNGRFSPCNENCRLEIKDLIEEIAIEVSQILESLSTKFSEHFDLNGLIPLWVVYKNKKASAFQNRINHNLELRKVDPELIHILDEYLSCLHVPGDFKMKSWRQYFYLENLSDDLIHFTELPATDDDTLKLIKILIGYNFNPLAFYEYMLEYSSNLISIEMPYEEQEMELLVLLKTIENIRPERRMGYVLDAPSILESICSFINRELGIVAKMKDVLMPYPANGSNGRNSNYYFEVATTIEELFFLIRVMLEVRFIKTKFKANLYSFVSRHIRTDRTKNPSTQYMRNVSGTSKEVPIRIVRKIRAWLMSMINYIDTNFGGQAKLWFLAILHSSFVFEIVL
ncbi:hypothetical protein [Pedobacter gandavensis]|uniref:Uncharacterized protein n=1 Tax=Pedobacter gandavensis TaxID=2679963 RepID=A0ABR6EUL8_9SPHI|nr:hypothetical protein [Pedobacter gandavensis]MBB2148955.1 hypothetical protein [Pedobacter gandavensis]